MNPKFKYLLAIIFGWIGGSVINIGLIRTGHKLFPIKGIDPNNMIALAEVMPTLEVEYFIFPFLAHALGTLIGAVIAGFIATSHKMNFSLSIGIIFLLGGIFTAFIFLAPNWFILTDIIIAYIPMAWLGGKIALKMSKNK